MKKLNIVLVIIFGFCLNILAQQPVLPQTPVYQEETGGEPEHIMNEWELRYCLPMKKYKESERLYLNIPVFREKGVRAIMPFGFRLSESSEVPLKPVDGNLVESEDISLHSSGHFETLNYLLCDSTVYGIKLKYPADNVKKQEIKDELGKIFRGADYSNNKRAVYSDEDFIVKDDKANGYIEIYSLFHYPIYDNIYPGVRQKVYYPPAWFGVSENEEVMLAFFNQESKENNVQSGVKIYYKGVSPIKFRSVQFILDDNEIIDLPLDSEYIDTYGDYIVERNTRRYLYPEYLQKIIRSQKVVVRITGENRSVEYIMPEFQRYSLYTTFEYFRWQATNSMVKYKGV